MSGGIDALALKEEDVTKFLGCSTHLGAQNVDFQMEQYVYKRKPDGMFWLVKVGIGPLPVSLEETIQ